MVKKRDLVRRVAKRLDGITQGDISVVLDVFFDEIIDSLKADETIYLAGFGKFSTTEYREVNKIAPNGKEVIIPAHKEPKFKFFKMAKSEFLKDEED